MLLSKDVTVQWNNANKKWYESKGYIFTQNGDSFDCHVVDLMKCSSVKVTVQCDYCGRIYETKYLNYNKAHNPVLTDCCNDAKCKNVKGREVQVILYGADNPNKLQKNKDKLKNRMLVPFEKIKEQCEAKGLTVLTTKDEYTGRKHKLKIICSKHADKGVQLVTFNSLAQSKYCCPIGGNEAIHNSLRIDGQQVYDAFLDKGIIPKFSPDEYVNNSQPLPFICPKHEDAGIQYRSYASLKTSKFLCQHCFWEDQAKKLKFDQDYVFECLKSRGLIPIEDEQYVNKDCVIHYRCVKHPNHIQTIRFGALNKTKQPCNYCREEESLSYLNRRLRSSIRNWQLLSKEACNNQCILTGSKSYDIHHLTPYNQIIKTALSLLNLPLKDKYTGEEVLAVRDKVLELHNKPGVCIRNDIHILYHQLYSKDEFTESDFWEFVDRYKSGEFTECLTAND
jgi:hypothetical protein